MALFQPYRGKKNELPGGWNEEIQNAVDTSKLQDGIMYFCTDTGEIFIDAILDNEVKRIQVNASAASKLSKDGEVVEIDDLLLKSAVDDARESLDVYSKQEVDEKIAAGGGSSSSGGSAVAYTHTLTVDSWNANDEDMFVSTWIESKLECGPEHNVPPQITWTSNQEEYSLIESATAENGVGISFYIKEKPTSDIGIIIIDHGGSKSSNSSEDVPGIIPTTFEWGDEDAEGDAEWWNGLKNWVATANDEELEECLGKTKSITLTEEIQGTTMHLVRCVGYNCDRDKDNIVRNTLTFHTANCLATDTVFGSSDASWNGSTMRTLCQNYYNALPFKASVCTVSKGTCTAINSSQSGTPTYQDETVFLPSDCEMGFPAGSDFDNDKGYAASYDEFCQQNTEKKAYQYYTDDSRRIKKLGDSGSADHYWERSLCYGNINVACRVTNNGEPGFGNYSAHSGFAPAFAI